MNRLFVPESFDVMGIDLGTCYSCVNVYRDNQVVSVPDGQGHSLIPSYVAYVSKQFYFGAAAKQLASSNPQSTVFDLKRMIAQPYSWVVRAKEENKWPFTFTSDRCGLPLLVLRDGRDSYAQYPRYFVSLFLQYLRNCVTKYMGSAITKAVITVPAFFTISQRQVTYEAAELAGITVLSLLEEPVAATFAYSIRSDLGVKHILIYDLGGGTFDVSLIRVEGNQSHVIASDGHSKLGGQDFDQKLMDLFLARLRAHSPNSTIFGRRLNALRHLAEEKKKELSQSEECSVSLMTSAGNSLLFTLTRGEFEQLIDDSIRETISICRRVLGSVSPAIDATQVDIVVLVGGSSRIPLVERRLHEAFPLSEVRKNINMQEVVAQGACMEAVNRECASHGYPFVFSGNVTPMVVRTIGVRVGGCGSVVPVLLRGSEVDEQREVAVWVDGGDGDDGDHNDNDSTHNDHDSSHNDHDNDNNNHNDNDNDHNDNNNNNNTNHTTYSLPMQVVEYQNEEEESYEMIGVLACPVSEMGRIAITVEMSMDRKGLLHVFAHEKGKERGSELKVNLISDIPPQQLDLMIKQQREERLRQVEMENTAKVIGTMITYIKASVRHFAMTMNPLGKKSKKGRSACERWERCVQELSPRTPFPELIHLQQDMIAEIEAIKLE
ncbi:hypothetical protein WA538_001485 [Blastocystis sp. DL]